MIFEDRQLRIHRVQYEIEFDAEHETAIVTPIIHAESVNTCLLLAAVRVDGHELLPTARVMLAPGANSVALKPVRIVRPFICVADGCPATYEMTLELFWSDGTSNSWSENIDIHRCPQPKSKSRNSKSETNPNIKFHK